MGNYKRFLNVSVVLTLSALGMTSCKSTQLIGSDQKNMLEKPVIVGKFQHIFNPVLTKPSRKGHWYTNDHCFVQDKNGLWHAYGIIGYRPPRPWDVEKQLFHITSEKLTGPWKEHKYALVADNIVEQVLWAPSALNIDGKINLFYNCGTFSPQGRILPSYGKFAMAKSDDNGYTFKRSKLNPIFADPGHARDVFVRYENNKYYFYYVRTFDEGKDLRSCVALRTSPDLKTWSPAKIVFIDPVIAINARNTESPFVVKRGDIYYLMVCQPNKNYNETRVYWSTNPENFPRKNLVTKLPTHASEFIQDKKGNWWISQTGWKKRGLFIAPIKWEKMKK